MGKCVSHHSIGKMKAAEPAKHPQYAFLTGLRGLAVLSVIFEHSPRWWQHYGPVGVECFFLLSSFLLTSALYKKCANYLKNSKSAAEWSKMLTVYYIRRIFRIYPFFLFVVFLLKYIVPSSLSAAMLKIGHINDLTWSCALTMSCDYHVIPSYP